MYLALWKYRSIIIPVDLLTCIDMFRHFNHNRGPTIYHEIFGVAIKVSTKSTYLAAVTLINFNLSEKKKR